MTKDADENGTTKTTRPNISTEHQNEGDARRPSDTLDKRQPNEQSIERKTSLTHND